jgi:hypothetical protein
MKRVCPGISGTGKTNTETFNVSFLCRVVHCRTKQSTCHQQVLGSLCLSMALTTFVTSDAVVYISFRRFNNLPAEGLYALGHGFQFHSGYQ